MPTTTTYAILIWWIHRQFDSESTNNINFFIKYTRRLCYLTDFLYMWHRISSTFHSFVICFYLLCAPFCLFAYFCVEKPPEISDFKWTVSTPTLSDVIFVLSSICKTNSQAPNRNTVPLRSVRECWLVRCHKLQSKPYNTCTPRRCRRQGNRSLV